MTSTIPVDFVVGMSRCGITPLCRCLNLHPDLAVFGESRFFGRCFLAPADASGYTRSELDELERLLRNFGWGATVGDEAGCLRNTSLDDLRALIARTFADAEPPVPPGTLFRALAEGVAKSEDKEHVLEKTPHHLRWLPRITRYLPDARFVVLLCEPYAFCRLQRETDPSYHPIAAALLWRGYVRAYERAVRRYADRMVKVEATELAADGFAALDRVQRFFGLEVHDLTAPFAPVVASLARADPEAIDVFWINLICGRCMRRHGYARHDTPRVWRAVVRSLATLPGWCRHSLGWRGRPWRTNARHASGWLRP